MSRVMRINKCVIPGSHCEGVLDCLFSLWSKVDPRDAAVALTWFPPLGGWAAESCAISGFPSGEHAMVRLFIATTALAVGLALPRQAAAQLPATGYVSTYAGVQLDGKQCVPAARDLSVTLLKRTLPFL